METDDAPTRSPPTLLVRIGARFRLRLSAILIGASLAFPHAADSQSPVSLAWKYGKWALDVAGATASIAAWGEQWKGIGHTPTPAEENALGLKYLLGKGVDPNLAEARTHFTRAMDGGDINGKINLAVMYMSGAIAALDHRTSDEESDWQIAGRMLRDVVNATANPVAEYDLGIGAEHEAYEGHFDHAIYWYDSAKQQGHVAAAQAVARLCNQSTLLTTYGRVYSGLAPISQYAWQQHCQYH